MLATAMIRGVSLDRHEPPVAGGVARNARRSNGGACSLRGVEAIDVPETAPSAFRKRLALKYGAAHLTAPLGESDTHVHISCAAPVSVISVAALPLPPPTIRTTASSHTPSC